MELENIVLDAVDARRVGRFWESVVGGDRLTDEPALFETRMSLDGGPTIDLCVVRVPEAPSEPLRLHPDLLGGARRDAVVERLLGSGADHLDIGQGDVPWVVLGDPEGNPFCVMGHRSPYRDTGPIAALPLDCSDPAREVTFWSWLTGWVPAEGCGSHTLRHPSLRGPLLELCPEPRPKEPGEKNRWHLDVRLGAGDDLDRVLSGVVERGGSVVDHDWGDLPWTVCADPSGNELCILPANR